MASTRRFHVGITRDMQAPDGTLVTGGHGVELLAAEPTITYHVLAEDGGELTPAHIAGCDAVLSLGPHYTAATFADPDPRLVLIARMGVGYDNIDMRAATAAGVLVTITPDGVRRPVATAILTYVLALAGKLLIKDRLVRSGRWHEKARYMGRGLTGRVIGIIGVGNIGRDLCRLLAPLEVRLLGYDPFVRPVEVAGLGIELVALEELLGEADFVCVNCPLTEETRGLIGARELALMKPTAYLINTARGPIVDGAALYAALSGGAIAGAGLDVFPQEPPSPDDPLLALDNVIVTPHALSWTDECFNAIEVSACQAILALARGEVPRYVVNREALDHPRVRRRLVAP